MTDTSLMNLGAWSIQAGLLAAAAALLARIVTLDVPVARYAWWRAVLLICLTLPLLQPWKPLARAPVDVPAPDAAVTAPATAPVAAGTFSAVTPAIEPAAFPWSGILLTLIFVGALLRIVWLAAGLVRLARLRRSGVQATESAAPELLASLIDTGADVRYVDAIRQPVTFGILPPVVLLPGGLRHMSPGVQRAVLAHELWHVRRRDWLWSFGEELLRSILWFHPAVWYLVSRVQGAREEVVDELSVRSTNARRSYLEALLAFAEEPAPDAAAPFIRRRQLFHRMMLITREGVMSPKRIAVSGVVMSGALVLTGWYGVLAFPLTTDVVPEPHETQQQAQPRDPRSDRPRPVTTREQELQAATASEPGNVKNWLELAKLQEDRGAVTDAEATLASALTATSGNRQVLLAQAAFFNRAGEFDKTMQALEGAAAQNPTDPRGHQLVATYYWEKAQKDRRLTPADKLMYIEAGIRATDRALAHDADYVEALTYKNILLRMKGNLDTDAARRQQLYAEADTLRARAIELAKQRPPAPPTVDPNAPPAPPPPPPPPPGYYEVDGQQAYRIGGQIPTPRKIRDVKPVYPQAALDTQVSGLVIVEAVIDTQGNVRSARVLRSVPPLDEAALEAVKQWQFTPTVIDGVAVPVIMTVTVNFKPE